MTIAQLYALFLQHPSIQTDTRKLKKGDIFFALSGDNFNGNDFALQALDNGAAYAVVDNQINSKTDRLIVVNDVLETLQQLAKFHRQQFSIPFIAITGSNGKTTTKELVNAVLSSHFKTCTTQGNLNNHIGIPLTLLSVKRDAEMAVIEMGANHQKEIEGYCKYTLPTHGIITNCGKAHLEGFGGMEGVRKGKGELFNYLKENNGTAFIFNDEDYLMQMGEGIDSVITYGTGNANVVGKSLPSETFLKVRLNIDTTANITTQLVGDYNLPNVLCAVAVGRHFKVPLEKIITAIENYAPDNSRSQMLVKGTNHIILDAYNANPSSMKLAIENIAKIKADKKILFIGGMKELGVESMAEHQKIVELIAKHSWEKVVLVGGDFEKTVHPFLFFKTSQQALEWAVAQHFNNATILIKGSRGIKMEKILEGL